MMTTPKGNLTYQLAQEQFAVVVRRVESLRRRAGESGRQGEQLFQALLARSFGEA